MRMMDIQVNPFARSVGCGMIGVFSGKVLQRKSWWCPHIWSGCAELVGRYLKAWGLSAQRPVRRAYERNDAAIAAWLKQVYPAIARQAKAEHAAIYRGDEM